MTPERRAFLESLKPFDVIRLNGTLRVIRAIHDARQWRGYPRKRMFFFSILKCSWTHRPYTLYSSVDLAHKRIELVARNYKPKLPIEELLQRDIDELGPGPSCLDCCDVKGIS